jgi:hypothetical protein
VLEARERLIGEAHDEQGDPAENMGMAVGIDLVQPRGETAGQADAQQQVRAPGGSERQHHTDAGLEERAIDRVRELASITACFKPG